MSFFQSLMEDLKSELSSDLEDVIVALMMPPREYDAYMIHEAIAVSIISFISTVKHRYNEHYETLKICSLLDETEVKRKKIDT